MTTTEELSFFARNIVDILKIAKQAFVKLDDNIQHTLGLAYNKYEEQVKLKYSLSKSYFTSNQSVDLYDYYVGTNLQSRNLTIKDVSIDKLLRHSRHSVISGSGGSGKSVLMRHLLLNTLNYSEYTPVIIELRDLNDEESNLNNLILETLVNFGLDLPSQYIEKYFKNGKFILLLDGFDEVNHHQRKKLIKDIKKLITKYNDCPIIISTRPDDIFKGIDDLTIFEMMPLTLELATKLVSKISFDQDIKNKFIDSLNKHLFESHSSFLSNPLLLSIMLLTYSENANIPNKLSLFYNQAYEALFHKHDASKGSYERQRKTNLDIQEFSDVFSLFSLQTYDKRIFKMSRMDCLKFAENSAKILSTNINTEDFLQDLLSATCLLVEDGLEIAYSHRSFQEYFVALYLSKTNPELQEKLIEKYIKNVSHDSVINLLFEINQEVVEQKIIIPRLEKIFEKIKLNKKVGIIHFYRFLKIFFNSIIIEKDGYSVTHDATYNDFWMFYFIKRKYKSNETYDTDKFCKQLFKEFGESGDNFIKPHEIKKLSSRSPIIKKIALSGSWLSIKSLQDTFDAYNEIIDRQKNKDRTLESLLNIQ